MLAVIAAYKALKSGLVTIGAAGEGNLIKSSRLRLKMLDDLLCDVCQ
jgi:hypothetical protein